jgi:uncharacterized membrane protein YjdF
MDAEASLRESAGKYLRPRARIVGGALLAGTVAGALLVLTLTFVGRSPVRAARIAFVLAALAAGGGLFGWAGSAMAGRGFEEAQAHLGTGTDWTEAKSRRAMARIGAFGAGAMAAAGGLEVVALAAV